jgi:hypothetical protein
VFVGACFRALNRPQIEFQWLRRRRESQFTTDFFLLIFLGILSVFIFRRCCEDGGSATCVRRSNPVCDYLCFDEKKSLATAATDSETVVLHTQKTEPEVRNERTGEHREIDRSMKLVDGKPVRSDFVRLGFVRCICCWLC